MRRVYMGFFVRGASPPGSGGECWVVNFLEPDLATPIGRIRSYSSAELLRQIAERGRAFHTLADRQAFDAAIQHGRGGIWLSLADDQYARLR